MDFERISGRELAQQATGEVEQTSTAQEAQAIAALQQAAMAPGTLRVIPGPDGVVTLPEGASLDHISVSGRDLVVQLPDGSQMVIVDGAVFVPQIVIGGVEIPALNLAALLIGDEPQPAAGPPQSSGGNFEAPVGAISDPFDLGDLLPPTELAFAQYEESELFPAQPDREPTISIVSADNAAGAAIASASVNEAGLPARGGEPAGSNAAANSETTTGSILFTAPDGLAGVAIDGVAVTAVGQTITGPFGTLTITAIAEGRIDYSYTLTDNTLNGNPADVFTVTVTDEDSDVATGTLTINVIDDAPTARADTDLVAAGTYGPEAGNVFTGAGTTSGAPGADTPGADVAAVTGVRLGASGSFAAVTAAGVTIDGQYGVLTVKADGSYSYVRNPGTPGGVNDVFNYQITDGDGDASTTTLTIAIDDSGVGVRVPTASENTSVSEAGLPARGGEPEGSAAATPAETTSGSIAITAPDGVASVTINGTAVTAVGQTITTPTGVFTITSIAPNAIGYSYTLTDNSSGNNTTDTLTVVVTDSDGDSATSPLVIKIVDDAPTARGDSDSVAGGTFGPATGNVITGAGTTGGPAGADTQGADGATVTSVGNGTSSVGAGTAIVGQYGVLTLNADGSYSYVRNPHTPGGVTDSFTYTLTDGDGDTSTAKLDILIGNAPMPEAPEPVFVTVYESGLAARAGEPAGSDSASASESASGTISFFSFDGVAKVELAGTVITPGSLPQTVFSDATGTLVVTSYSYDPATGQGEVGFTYTLTDNTLTDPTDLLDFPLVVTDLDGGSHSRDLLVEIIDDVPVARDDAPVSVAEDAAGTAGGNVLANDTQGADTATLTSVTIGGVTTAIAAAGTTNVVTANGTYTFQANGAWTFDPSANLNNASGVDASFSYVITDGDNDTSTANQPITITDGAGPAAGAPLNLFVDDQFLPGGNMPDGSVPATPHTGIITFTAGSDAIVSMVFGTDLSGLGGGLVWTRVSDTQIVGKDGATTIVTLDLTRIGDNAQIKATLSDNYDSHPGIDIDDLVALGSVNVVATDIDGDTATGTVSVSVSDDLPIASDQTDDVTEDGPVVADGNVMTGVGGTDANTTDGDPDRPGADGAVVTSVRFDGTTVAAGTAIAGKYGTLVINADGSYSYTLDNANPLVQALSAGQGLSDVFFYTLTDGDGDTDTTTLKIRITGANDGVTITGLGVEGGELIVNEDDLLDGSSPDAPALIQTGSFSFNAADGLGTVTVGGVAVISDGSFTAQTITTALGTLKITGFTPVTAPDGSIIGGSFTYRYTLTDNTLTHGAPGEDSVLASFPVIVTDADGSTANASLDVRIIDDVPVATDEPGRTVVEGATVTGTLDFVGGADGARVTHVNGAALVFGVDGYSQAVDIGHGAIRVKADGSYSFTADASVNGAGAASAVFTVTDGDNDTDTGTVSFTVTDGAGPAAGAPITLTLDDQNLADGSTPAGPDSDTDSIVFTPGSDAIASIAFGASVAGLGGGLTWTRVSDTQIVGKDGATTIVTLDLVRAGDSAQVKATLNDNYDSHPGINLDDLVNLGSVGVVATDTDGDTAVGTATVTVSDDVPVARDDTDRVNEGATETGNVLTGIGTVGGAANADAPGADGYHASGAVAGVASINVPANSDTTVDGSGNYQLSGQYGVLTLNKDGSYSYKANANAVTSNAVDSFTYTIRDGDGDTTTAMLRINVNNVTLTADNQTKTVYEAALDTSATGSDLGAGTVTGSNPGLATETVTGQLAATGAVGYTPQTITGNYGLFKLNANGSYTYTLTKPYDTTPDANNGNNTEAARESFTYTASDASGNTVTGTIKIDIVDDKPDASNDTANLQVVVDDLGVGSIVAKWTNVDMTSDNTTNYDRDGDGQTDEIRWGTGSNGSSGYGFVDNPALSSTPVLTNQTFYLGTFTHFNQPVNGGTLESTTLSVTFMATINGEEVEVGPILVNFTHTETSNTSDPNASRDIISIATSTATVNIAGQNYTLDIRGFVDENNNIVSTVRTYEGQTNSYQLAVRFVSSDSTNVTKTGDVLQNDVRGADGGLLTAVTGYNSSDNTANGASNYEVLGRYGKLVINKNGSYTYTLTTDGASVPAGAQETFSYTITDGDGDTDTANLVINISKVDGGDNFATGDRVLTNQSGAGAIVVPEAALLYNDNPGTTVAGVTPNTAGGDNATRAGGNVTFTDGGTNGGSFTYTGSNGGNTEPTNVSVDRGAAGNATINGTDYSEILIGRDGSADTLNGNGGKDYLLGKGGNDTLNGGIGHDILVGGKGEDTLTGGSGADRFVFSASDSVATVGGSGRNGTISGFDKISDFNVSQDILDLAGTPFVAVDTNGTNGNDSALRVSSSSGSTVKSHAISNGMISFATTDSYSSGTPIDVNSDARVAAVVQYLQLNDLGAPGATVAFVSDGDTYVYQQVGDAPNAGNDILVKLEDTSISNLSSLIGSTVTPVVLDLDGDGVELVDRSAGVTFDYDVDGVREATAWAGSDDGILALDRNGDGVVNNGAEIVFGGNGLTDLQGLAANFDSNGDGILDASDIGFSKFGVWQDANGNGVSEAGEFRSLGDMGIASLKLTSDGKAYSAANDDVVVHGETVFTRTDGSTGVAGDVSFATGGAARPDEAGRQAVAIGLTGLASALVAASLVAAPLLTPESGKTDAKTGGDMATPAADATQSQADVSVKSAPDGEAMQPLALDAHKPESAPLAHLDRGSDDDGGRGGDATRMADEGMTDHASTPLLSDSDAAIADIADHAAPLFIDMVAMPAIPAAMAPVADAVAAPQSEALASVLADALGGGAGDGPDIDALLAAATGDSGDPAGLLAAMGGNDAAAFAGGMATGHGFDFAMLTHDAVLAVNHG
ncbi:beta strand repeat-containing protein [Sphingomonas cavernae]|uniref:Tandem-95 repeat protein n=1 Tax=Sphingomonas cavernae TaxID=2320861 RepID=A0A418WQD1_9SPHN|nr:VCBS domain-containing protein [Sphingomonas cavernae]RJF93455.1 tandem-95 repeat protein [Sphingomonas cavernae]